MGQAFRCDRCKKLFHGLPERQLDMEQIPINKRQSRYVTAGEMYQMCLNCSRDFERFFDAPPQDG